MSHIVRDGHTHGVDSAALRASATTSGRSADTTRLETIYARHRDAIFAYCRRRTNTTDAEDATSEVFSVALRRLDVVPHEPETLPWLYGVAFRVISHQWRSKRRYQRLLDTPSGSALRPTPTPETEAVRRVEHELVERAASRLSKRDRELLRLVMWEELTHNDIAVLLGVRPESVRQRFHRAKKRLAREYISVGGHAPAVSEGGPSL
ncbi:MAG: sigma-70 family RNA polymerase sigma factor [Acidimicrobiia bacterium]